MPTRVARIHLIREIFVIEMNKNEDAQGRKRGHSTSKRQLMDDHYDVIILGTGLKESLLAGLLASISGKKILHIDQNEYYGGDTASLNL